LNLDFFRMAFDVSLSGTVESNVGSHFQEYLGYPLLFGVSTRGASVARMFLRVIGTVAFVVAAVATFKRLASSAAGWRFSDTDLCLFNGILMGVLLSLADAPIFPHYHLTLFPLESLWIPMVALAYLPKPRAWLASVWLGGAVCTFAFLQFIHQHCGAPSADYGISYRCKESQIAAAWVARPPRIDPLIRAGQEDVIAQMLARGERLPGSCQLADGQIDQTLVRATYSCAEGRIDLQLVHPSRAPANALLTRDFAVVLVDGSPPPGLFDAIAAHVRRYEPAFQWLLEFPPETSAVREPPALRPYGYYLPVLTSRQVLLTVLGGAVILLLSSPWWGSAARR
jgi:hypothetical protein